MTFKDIIWRPYQKECFGAIKKFYQGGGKSALIVQATGTGKRAAAVHVSTKFNRTLFICHTDSLIKQAYKDFCDAFGYTDVGIVKAERFESDKRIVIASVQTLYNRLHKFHPEDFDHVAVDECHLFMSRTFFESVTYFTPKLLTGWTATPTRLDGLSMLNLFEEVVFEYNLDEAIKDEHLAELDAIQVKTNVDLKNIGKSTGDFSLTELRNKVDIPERNDLIVSRFMKHAKGRQGMCFAVDTIHAVHIKEHFDDREISCEVVVSNKEVCPDKDAVMKRFENREFSVIISIDMLAIGYDYDNIGMLMMARPTTSLARFIQMIGRGTRKKDDAYIEEFSQKCLVLDFVDNTSSHNLVNTWTIDEGKEIEDRVFVSEENKEKLQEEKQRKERVINTERDSDVRVNLMKLPKVKISNSEAMHEPATDPQLEWLKRLGVYDSKNTYTKRQASAFISNSNAAGWQKRKLAEWGYQNEGATIGQYQNVKRKIDQENKYKMNLTF